MNSLIFKKVGFYTLLLASNILGLGFIGISFLSGPGVGEGTFRLTPTFL